MRARSVTDYIPCYIQSAKKTLKPDEEWRRIINNQEIQTIKTIRNIKLSTMSDAKILVEAGDRIRACALRQHR